MKHKEILKDEGNESACQTTFEDLRQNALAHYREASAAIHHWNSFVEHAIEAYLPTSEPKNEKLIVGSDNICPITKTHCDDEMCGRKQSTIKAEIKSFALKLRIELIQRDKFFNKQTVGWHETEKADNHTATTFVLNELWTAVSLVLDELEIKLPYLK